MTNYRRLETVNDDDEMADMTWLIVLVVFIMCAAMLIAIYFVAKSLKRYRHSPRSSFGGSSVVVKPAAGAKGSTTVQTASGKTVTMSPPPAKP